MLCLYLPKAKLMIVSIIICGWCPYTCIEFLWDPISFLTLRQFGFDRIPCIELDESLSEQFLVLCILHGRLSETCLLHWFKQENTLVLIIWLGLLVSLLRYDISFVLHIFVAVWITTIVAYWSLVRMLARAEQDLFDFSLWKIRFFYWFNRVSLSCISSIKISILSIIYLTRRMTSWHPRKCFSALNVTFAIGWHEFFLFLAFLV